MEYEHLKEEMLIRAPFQIWHNVTGARVTLVGASLCRSRDACCWTGECCRQGHPALSAAGTVDDDGGDLEQVYGVSLSCHSSAAGTLGESPFPTPFISGECDWLKRVQTAELSCERNEETPWRLCGEGGREWVAVLFLEEGQTRRANLSVCTLWIWVGG